MFLVDTNIFVYACDEGRPEHAACARLLNGWRVQSAPWYTTWPILYEFLRVTTHSRVLRKPLSMKQAVGVVRNLLDTPGLSPLLPTERHGELLAQVVGELPSLGGSISHDLATAVIMREHGIRRIVTHDADFHRFEFLEVVDPLCGDGADAVRERPERKAPRHKRTASRR